MLRTIALAIEHTIIEEVDKYIEGMKREGEHLSRATVLSRAWNIAKKQIKESKNV